MDDLRTSRAGVDFGGTAGQERVRPASPLAEIEERIFNAARAAQEIGNKLHEHANVVHGPVPEEGARAANGRDMPDAKLDRIFVALDALDAAQSYMAQGAGRNTTLA